MASRCRMHAALFVVSLSFLPAVHVSGLDRNYSSEVARVVEVS